MKYIHHKSFGYPVFRSNAENPDDWDYPNIAFEPEISLGPPEMNSEDEVIYKVSYHFSVNEKKMRKHIESGNAAYAIKVNCAATYYGYTKVLKSDDELEGVIEINASDVIDQLVITTFIVAKKQFKLESESFHDDYKGLSFDIDPGFVLAYPEETIYYTGKDMYRNITSIFDFSSEPELEEGELRCELDGDKIVIVGTTKQIKQIDIWGKSKGETAEIARAAVFFPFLLHAISKITDPDEREDFEDWRWCKVIMAKCAEQDINLNREDSYQIAQKLAQLPLRALSRTFC